MKTVKTGIIGLGNMGKKYAEMIYHGQAGALELTAVFCRSGETVKWAEAHLGIGVEIYRDIEVMYQKGVFDAVLIVTPHKTHPALAVQAFSHGKHVFCDKPSGISVLQCEEMNRVAESSGKIFAMMFHQRMYDKYRRIKELIDGGEVGKIKRVLLENSRYFRTRKYHQSGNWRSSWNGEGGGALLNQGQHILDIWQWLFGMPESVYGQIPFGKYNDFLVDDEATIFMKYADNVTGVFILSTGEGSFTERLEVVGTKGKLLLEEDTLHIWRYSESLEVYRLHADCNARELLQESYCQETFVKEREPYQEMLSNFARRVLEGEKLTAPGTEGRFALELTNAAYLSAWKDEKIFLPLDGEEYERELKVRMEQEKQSFSH